MAMGGSAFGVLRGAALVEAQGPDIDYSVLTEHELVTPASDAAPVRADETAPRSRARRRGPSELPDSPPDSTGSTQIATDEEWVTEHRALWIEPGYLVLLEWHRPAADETPIIGLEGADDAISIFLGEQSDISQTLHDTDGLSALEQAIAEMLIPAVAPAEIDVIHLDHDCNVICGAGVVETTRPPVVRGRRR